MELDRDHIPLQLGGLATGCGTEVERALPRPRRDDDPGKLGAAALWPDQACMECLLVDPLSATVRKRPPA